MLQKNEFRQSLHENAKKLADIAFKDKTSGDELHPLHLQKQQFQQQIEEHMLTLEKKMHDGMYTCLFSLKECQDIPMSFDEVVQELQSCMSSINSPASLSKLGESILLGTTWKTKLGISDKCMNTLYLGAKNIFNKKEYEEAETAFFVLCSFDQSKYSYWIGLGHSAFQNKNYKQALNAYSMASSLDPEDSWPHIWAANTFEEKKDFDYAKMAIGEALSIEKAKTPKNNELIQSLEERFQNIKQR